MSEKLRKYGGYVSAIKNNEANSQAVFIESDSPMSVVSKLMEKCKELYPESDGWHSHASTQADGIVIC